MKPTDAVRAPLRLIVNADDLGLHPAVRRSVEACAAIGSITSASMLANGPDQDALRPYPGISLGAHLNILRGRPISPASEVRSLVGPDGLFLGSVRSLALRILRGAIDRDEVRLEWSRQVGHLRARGVEPDHVDGERHTHCLPGLFTVACEVARTHGIGWIRRPDERYGNLRLGGGSIRRAVLRALCARAQTGPALRTTDAVWGIAEQGASFSADACERALKGIGPRIVEVVCHPGLERPGDPAPCPSFGRMRVRMNWEAEHRSLCGGTWTEVASRNGWRLTSFERV